MTMTDDNGYLVVEWDNDPHRKEPKRHMSIVYSESDLFEIVDRAKNESRLITVYRIGRCLLDWS